MKKKTQRIVAFLLCAMVIAINQNQMAYGASDGAYTVSISHSYRNPETGETADGSTNVALGESMIESMLEPTALIEEVGGKTYVTIGLGLMSNVSNVRIKVQTSGGSYKTAVVTKTGSGTKNGDTVNHYRFQINSTNGYISPVLYITPMGRDVQFFIKLKMGTKKKGTGIYHAALVKQEETAKATPKATKIPTTKPQATPEATKAPVKKPQATPEATETPVEKPQATSEATKAPTKTSEARVEPTAIPEQTKSPLSTKQKDPVKPICAAVSIVSLIGSVALFTTSKRCKQEKDGKEMKDE